MHHREANPRPEAFQPFSVGDPLMDEQHAPLVAGLNAIIEGILGEAPQEATQTAFRIFRQQAMEHFHAEEALMARTSYPRFVRHRSIHGMLIAHLDAIIARHSKCPIPREGVSSIHAFLGSWLFDHFQGEDLKFADHLNGTVKQKRLGIVASPAPLSDIRSQTV